MVNTPTTCPFCGCGCGFFLQSRDGSLVGVAPSEQHPVSGGKLCARGWNAHEAALWGDRLLHPILRTGGKTEPVNWDVALEHVAARLRGLRRAGKPLGVLGSARATNEENYLAGRLARAVLGTNHVDFCYHAACRPLLQGIEDVVGYGWPTAHLSDIESSDTILLLEGDLARSHTRAASSVMRALERGARLIAIGCARTQMARLASCFLEAAPGRQGEALDGLLRATLDIRPGGSGCELLSRQLREVEATKEMREAAQWLAAEHAVFLMGPSAVPPDQLRKDAAAIASLAAVSGHIEKPGSGFLLLAARNNTRGACEMGLGPDRLPGYERIDNPHARERLERLWGSAVPAERGLDAAEMLQSASGLVVLADDPAIVLAMGQRARGALDRLEFLVVLDAFATPPAHAAEVVLPIASYAETEGTYTNIEGRLQRVRPAVRPPGEAREGWKVLAELCARLDPGAAWGSASDVLKEIAAAAPGYAGAAQALGDGWESSFVGQGAASIAAPHAAEAEIAVSAEYPYVLAWDSVFDWTDDPLVAMSPTLSRDGESRRKLFPNGFVEMSIDDARALGVREGWRVKLRSIDGEAIVPVRQRNDLRRGTLLAPYGLRDGLASLFAGNGITAVCIERA